MNSLAVITARGGSKRLPRKNIREFCGQSIISYSIKAALKSNLFDEVMVSTDDEEIAKVAKDLGASIPFMRSDATSDDFASTADVLLEVLERYAEIGNEPQVVCCLYPTAPFVTAKRLQDAMRLFKEKKADTVMPITGYSYPPQRGLVEEDGILRHWFPENIEKRSQDLECIYHDSGQFYICDTAILRRSKSLFGGRTVGLKIPAIEVQDIDDLEDWELAELKFRESYYDDKRNA